MASNGGVSGTPNTAGTYSGVVTASNGINPNATQAFTIVIYPANNTGGASVTTLFNHDNRQFHGNMFDVTVTNPLQITGFDMSVGWGRTTVSVYYRSGSYVGNETNPAAWTLLGSVRVTGQGPNNRTPIAITTPVLSPGTYGFYAAVTPIFDIMSAVDLHYTAGTLTVGTSDLSITAGNGVGGSFGDPAACVYRGYPNNPCIFNDRIWNGTIYYTPVGGAPASTSLQSFSVAATEAPVMTSAAPAAGTVGMGYNHSYTANGTAPISYAVTAGSLPPGLTLTAEGLLSGTPTAAGMYTGEV
ncbi:MAG: hypothetical protein JNM70_24610, partial [Anaerolineae bacterium]|nr:hypothetical protein [Anaerolineae bacterium]